jgi:hypothetical protein
VARALHLSPHIVVAEAGDAAPWYARGERHGQLTDPYGHRWNIAQRLRDVSPDKPAAAAAAQFGPAQQSGTDG